MDNTNNYTPSPEDNLLGITDKNIINEYEAKGIAEAELFMFEINTEEPISTTLILNIHRIAFGELYDWAGKWRKIDIVVGQIIPPQPEKIPYAIYQFIDNLNFKISIADTISTQIDCIVYAHYEFIKIHPFNNGNGRTGRILMNIVAMKLGYQPLSIYSRAGEERKIYIEAMRAADLGNFQLLSELISKELLAF